MPNTVKRVKSVAKPKRKTEAALMTSARARQLSANPGTRTKVPTSMLSTEHRAMRLANRKRATTSVASSTAAPQDPLNSPLTTRSLDQRLKAEADLQYAPVEQELAGERAVSQQMQRNIPAWFAEYQGALGAATSRIQQAYQVAAGQQQQTAQSLSTLDDQQRSALQGSMSADAAQRGTSADPGVADTAQRAAAARQSTLGAQAGLTAGLGAANMTYSIGREATGAAQKVTAQVAEANRSRTLDRTGQDIARERGAFTVKRRGELIDAEHTKDLERKAFGLNVAEAEADATAKATATQQKATSDAAKLRLRREENATKRKIDAAKLGLTERQVAVAERRAATYEKSSKAKGGGKDRSESQRNLDRASRTEVNRAMELIKKNSKAAIPVLDKDGNQQRNDDGTVKTKPANLTSTQIRALLVTGGVKGQKAVSKDYVNVAYDVLKKGYISEANIRALHRMGVSVQSLGYPTEREFRRKAKAKKPALKLKADSGDILAGSR